MQIIVDTQLISATIAAHPSNSARVKRRIKMTTFTYEAVRLNGKNGYIATRRIDGVHAGKAFGKTKAAARAAFES